jgi:hypothetical protein
MLVPDIDTCQIKNLACESGSSILNASIEVDDNLVRRIREEYV